MNKAITLRRLLRAPPAVRSSLLPLRPRATYPSFYRLYATAPNVAQTSFWLSLIPKPLRQSSPRAALKKKVRSKEWNPATFFIVIFLLIGSMSIQMIALRNEFAAFSRRADAKIGLLKEVIERIQNGEEVDVEGLLGTGDKEREKEWEEVLQEIEREDQAWEQSKRTKPKHGEGDIGKDPPTKIHTEVDSPSKTRPRTNAPSGFF
ncbi:hypothetical protein L207DRAFT_586140 [Hyaloscypha variabilis F]|uniref:Uncharacterized protein n=1 Tax=Hyaloscypha variabilis (strain UAMH 11265 / GT02V1 / F) TaxID=1149755 RepID=A0A2J6RD49_HYAVF|nr:hypothetical protein L207DRAFT_586140 [Hyaloscypha variabilis F]